MDKSTAPVITLDGLSSAGKGTIGLKLAHSLAWHYLDSGIFYRLLALEATRQSITLQDEKALAELASHISPEISFADTSTDNLQLHVMWQKKEVTNLLRTEDYGLKASQVAVYPLVRKALLSIQRSFRKKPGLVADGRDMGQVIFPNAICKFFLTASCEVRIKRRQEQLKQQGNYASLSAVKNAIVQRDKSDQTRLETTLKVIPDAYVIDTTYLSITQVMTLIKKKLSTMGLYFH